jgi:hypothetical protein
MIRQKKLRQKFFLYKLSNLKMFLNEENEGIKLSEAKGAKLSDPFSKGLVRPIKLSTQG